MSRIVYERMADKPSRRYVVEFFSSAGRWAQGDGPGYRSLWAAKFEVLRWNGLGHDARVIDTHAAEVLA